MKRLIDLDEALRELDGVLSAKRNDEYQQGIATGLALTRVWLLSLPVVEVEEQDTSTVTYGLGKWIEKEEDGYHGGGYTECSICGQRYSWGGYFEVNGFRYCPRCGHRMEAQE